MIKSLISGAIHLGSLMSLALLSMTCLFTGTLVISLGWVVIQRLQQSALADIAQTYRDTTTDIREQYAGPAAQVSAVLYLVGCGIMTGCYQWARQETLWFVSAMFLTFASGIIVHAWFELHVFKELSTRRFPVQVEEVFVRCTKWLRFTGGIGVSLLVVGLTLQFIC